MLLGLKALINLMTPLYYLSPGMADWAVMIPNLFTLLCIHQEVVPSPTDSGVGRL